MIGLGWPILALLALAPVVLAQGIVRNPELILVGMAGALALTAAATLPQVFARLFISLLGLLLAGYAFFGRAFSHLGSSPVFVGELVLGVGLLGVLRNPRRFAPFKSAVGWFYLAFAMWGAARAIPYLRVYGVDVLRDSVTWAYGLFALLIPASIVRPGWLLTLLQRYSRWAPVLVLWLPIGLLASHLFPGLLPVDPESGEHMVFVKPGDAGVHLAGAATFLLLGLHHAPGVRARGGLLGTDWFLGLSCVLAFIAVAVLGRGGSLAFLVAILAVLVLRPIVAVPKVVLIGAAAVAVSLALLASNVSIELGRRDFSVQQLTSNLMSIVGDTPDDERNLEQTKDWRLRWWTKVVDYTVFGPYFWTGKGFGINLEVDDGVRQEAFNRSPHSAHMTILARTGVPGEVLWLLLQSSFGVTMLAAYLRARRRGREWWARVNLWILAYWLAFMVDISFAVYLEGPHGGIWFWSIIGLGIAVAQAQRLPDTMPSRPPAPVGYGHEAPARS
ncbi:MAG: O-antigen ligase family protein [Gemmatimonadales bacterium]